MQARVFDHWVTHQRNKFFQSSQPKARSDTFPPQPSTLSSNDVYNIDETVQEPAGGAARFVHAIRTAVLNYPGPSIVLFSGDAFSPAPLTNITDGAEMPPVLNACNIDVACLGNHEFDRGLPVLRARISETDFPWIISNVTDRSTGLPVAGVKDVHVLLCGGLRFGFIGLASSDWLETLSEVDPDELVCVDYVAAADQCSALLRDEHRCDYIIALTHMRQPDDERLAREAKDVDLILGGHDHVFFLKLVNGRYILKSGTDFKVRILYGTFSICPLRRGDPDIPCDCV